MDANSQIFSSMRDKLILIILGILGLGCLLGICWAGVKDLLTPLSAIVGALSMGFTGRPSSQPPTESKTTETTVSSTSNPVVAADK